MRCLRHNSFRSALVFALFVYAVAGAMGGVLRAQATDDPARRQQTVLRVPRAEMPQGPQGRRYTQTFPVFGGVQPYHFTVAGTVPAGMHWTTAANGMVLDGVPRIAGRFPIAVTVTDAAGELSRQDYVLDITPDDTGDSVNVPVAEAVGVTDLPSVGSVVELDVTEPISVTDAPSLALPVLVNISETISVTDTVGSTESVFLAISEPISVTDTPIASPPLQVNVSEAISVTDTVGSTESVFLAVNEPITVTDAPLLSPPLQVSIAEAISVTDTPGTTESVLLAINEPISVTDTPLLSPPLQVNIAEAISVTDTLGTTESVLLAINEPITVTDAPLLSPPLQVSIAEAISVSDLVGSTESVSLAINEPITVTDTPSVPPSAPVVTWTQPAAIVYGTPLSAAQLDATASVPGSFTYSPGGGAVLPAGVQTLSVTFTPNDTTSYLPATATVTLTVNKATPVVTWNPPPSIVYGTATGSAQQTATANVPGSFFYTTPNGKVFPAGTHPLGVAFTPADTADYQQVSAYTTLTVTQATPVITWPTPAAIPYGTPLSATQLNAKTNVAGTSFYTGPAGLNPAGTLLPVGLSTLGFGLIPADSQDYAPVSAYTQVSVYAATTTTSITVTAKTTASGTTATIIAKVTPQIGGVPTGTVKYLNVSTTLGTAPVGVAFTTPVLPVGGNNLTAVYSGDANFLGSSSPVTVVKGVAATH